MAVELTMEVPIADILKRLDSTTQDYVSVIQDTAGRLNEDIYLVGGPVRDLMLGRDSIDLDIVVRDDGIRFATLLANRIKGSDLTVYRERLTATIAVPGRRHIDVATMRTEVYDRPGALPRVEAAPDILRDLSRRDFTINAMAVKLDGADRTELVDPFDGHGDLASSVVRALHPGSFIDDPTRIYRAIRFEVRLGFRIETQTLKALKGAVSGGALKTISGQRRMKEINIYLAEERPFVFISRAYELGALADIVPDHKTLEDIRGMYEKIVSTRSVTPEDRRLLLLAAMFVHLTPNEVSIKAGYFGMTKRQRTTIIDTMLLLNAIGGDPSRMKSVMRRYTDSSRLLAYLITNSDLLLPYISL